MLFDNNHDNSFYQQLSIHIDQPVAGMSISPSKRDVVLASRKGLLIIDLENPFDLPRSLPYFTRWEVTEVQWNPHTTRDTWIATTCNQRVLIWNVMKPHLQSVEREFTAHDRAISDVNWSNVHPEILVTSSLDTSIKIWDMRTGSKNVGIMSNWNAAVSQIDCHPSKDYLIASAQEDNIKIWDIRKGTVPLIYKLAHDRKIANLHWHGSDPKNLLSCSFDKTIKFWNIDDMSQDLGCINTGLPIGRARYTPFGEGVLSMPLRCQHTVSLWSTKNYTEPVFEYRGHTGVVKEFVWRVNGENYLDSDDREFQLVTWSHDQQLRLWPVGENQLNAVGHTTGKKGRSDSRPHPTTFTYRVPWPQSRPRSTSPEGNTESLFKHRTHLPILEAAPASHGPSRSGSVSPENSTTKFGSIPLHSDTFSSDPLLAWNRRFSVSRRTSGPNMNGHGNNSNGEPQSRNISEELSAIARKYKEVKFEKISMATRSCTMTLYGPWAADSGQVFLRVNIQLSAEYPNQSPPVFDLQKSTLIPQSIHSKLEEELSQISLAFANKGLPSLEACTKYLLGLGSSADLNPQSQSDGSDEELIGGGFGLGTKSNRRHSVKSLDRDDHNVPFPKLCGATFSPEGRLVIFFSSLQSSQVEAFQMPQGMNKSNARNRNSYYHSHPRSYKSLNYFRSMCQLPTRLINHSLSNQQDMSNFDDYDDPDDPDDLLIIPSLYYRPRTHSRTVRHRHSPSPPASESPSKGADLFRSSPSDPALTSLINPSKDIPTGHNIHFRKVIGITCPDRQLGESIYLSSPSIKTKLQHLLSAAKLNGRKDLIQLWNLVQLIILSAPPQFTNNFNSNKNNILPSIQKFTKSPLLQATEGRVSSTPFNFNMLSITETKPSGDEYMNWGSHPFGKVLVKSIFQHYQRYNDIQTLAILSYIFTLDTTVQKSHPTPIPTKSTLHFPKNTVNNLTYNLTPQATLSESPKDYFSPFFKRAISKSGHSDNHRSPSAFSYSIWSGSQHELSPRQHPRPLPRSNISDTSPMGVSSPSKPSFYSIPNNNSRPEITAVPISSRSVSPISAVVTTDWANPILGKPASSIHGSDLRPAYDPSEHSQRSFDTMQSGATGGQDSTLLQGYSFSQKFTSPQPQPVPLPSIIPPTDNPYLEPDLMAKTGHYRLVYAEILYRWGLFSHRAEILKNLEFNQSLRADIEWDLNPSEKIGISRLPNLAKNSAYNAPKAPSLCSSDASICIICHTKMKGVSIFCIQCGHGGHPSHIKEWFKQGTKYSEGIECPSGCGCYCESFN